MAARVKRFQVLFGMVTEFNTGQMELITKASGVTIKLKEKARFGMLKEMSIKASSEMTWQMVMENILISMGQCTKVSSKMMFRKVMVKKSGLTELSMLELIKTE